MKWIPRRPPSRLLTVGAVFAAAFSALFTGSCAKVPEAELPSAGRRLAVTMRVRNQIHLQNADSPNGSRIYYYFAVINRTNIVGGPGPYPKTGLPWANGVAASSQAGTAGFTVMVVYDGRQGLNGYQMYRVPVDSEGQVRINPDTIGPFPGGLELLGEPVRSIRPQTGENTLYFEINLNDIPLQKLTDGQEGTDYLHINLIATDYIPGGGDGVVSEVTKLWDAIGNGGEGGSINRYLSFSTEQNFQHSNADIDIEPAGDVRNRDKGPVVNEPDLDIVDWTIELRDANTGG